MSVTFKNYELAAALAPVIFIPLILFAGFMVKTSQIPAYFKEFEYISPFKYSF